MVLNGIIFVLVYASHILRWMNSVLGEGYKKELEIEDLYEARRGDKSEYLGNKLEKY